MAAFPAVLSLEGAGDVVEIMDIQPNLVEQVVPMCAR